MIKLRMEKLDGFVVFVIDNSNTLEQQVESVDIYFESIEQCAKPSDRVLFKIDELDRDGIWHDLARYWLARKESIHFVYKNEEVLSTIMLLFGPEATFHKTVEDAIRAIN